jgi:SAM-dependent methyltransferase
MLPKTGNILEVGSRNVNGSVRSLFDQSGYIGIDLEEGPGVDRVMDAHTLVKYAWPPSFDLIIATEVLEHSNKPWLIVDGMHRLLKPSGKLLISVPANGFPEHRHPIDVFRFMPDALDLFFFEGMRILDRAVLPDPGGFQTLIGIGQKGI